MTAAAGVFGPSAPPRLVRLFGRDLKLFVPTRNDPRIKLFLIILALQVLGQTVLGFKVSIAQILVTMLTCLALELGVFIWRDGIIAWPSSALQTGNSIAFILRASGTQHGDWWSLNGIHWFILASVIGLGSKYLIRPGGRHIFNPSNVGIVWVLMVIGPRFVFPQYLWWGPLNPPVVASLLVIAAGAVWLLRKPVGMIPMAISFLVPFTALVGIFAVSGRSFIAAWHHTPITGFEYWVNICFSPEVFIFVFFMMSDPRTAPRPPLGRIIYGVAVAFLSAGLLLFQTTEFGVKLGILSGLIVVCAVVPFIEAFVQRRQARGTGAAAEAVATRPLLPRLSPRMLSPAVIASVVIAVSAPAVTMSLLGNPQVMLVERGLLSPQ